MGRDVFLVSIGTTRPEPAGERGFTLIELVMVIVLLAILAAVAIPRLADTTGMKASATAPKLQSDIVYAQELAMTRNQRYRVYFNTAPAPGSGYAVVNDANGNSTWGEAGEFAQDPASGGSLSVTLDTGDYAGITISVAGLSGSFVEFSSLGVSFDSGGQLGAAATITVSASGSPVQTVSIQPETGMVSVP